MNLKKFFRIDDDIAQSYIENAINVLINDQSNKYYEV